MSGYEDIIAYIELTDWGIAFNGEHFTSTIRTESGDQWNHHVQHQLTTGAAGRMNKKDGSRLNRPGDMSGRFETEESAIKESIKQIRKEWPYVKIIILGNNCYCNPQKVVWAVDEGHMNVMNEMYEEYELVANTSKEFWMTHRAEIEQLEEEWDETITWIREKLK